jgi:hypothetical protein
MQKRAPAPCFLAFAIACAVILAACGGGSGNSTVASVAITPTSANVPINGTAEFTATVNLTNSSTLSSTSTVVTWEVNGVAGGSTATGTIVASTTDLQVGVYTAPGIVPSTNNGEVNITAVAPQNPNSTTTTTTSATITSNTAVITIGVGEGLAITELTTSVPSGATHQFAATLNGLSDPNATWSVSSTNGGDIGTINSLSGLYTAPDFPPPGGTVTITATDPTVNTPATATAQIVYSNHSLSGPFAFSYSGSDSDGFFAAAGSFVADGQGNITSGIEDVDSFLLGVSPGALFTGTYVVGPDGRTTAEIDTGHGVATWQFALTTNQHALLIRFDTSNTGSGTIDQQNLNDLTTSPTVVVGPYAFSASGTDAAFKPMALAGEFTSNGSSGIPASGSMIDVNDGGTVTTESPTVSGSYTLDTGNSGTGRGTLTLPSTTANQLQFAFYVIDSTHLHIVEIDGNAFLAGDVYTGASAAGSFAGTYVFTAGGASSTVANGAYAVGGAFVSSGSGSITGGALDTNNAGTVTTNTTISTSPYSVNGTTGRIGLTLSSSEFAVYQTAQGTAVMVELDPAAVSTGLAYPQVSADASTVPGAGSFAFVLGGQGLFHEVAGSAQPDAEGQLTLSGTAFTGGNFDINNFNATFKTDPVNTTNSALVAPATNGRGTATLEGQNPDVTYKLVYYLIDGNTALLFDQDTARVAIGSIARQF